ncbi:WD40/YVTN/BNR-like repeat-containing protein [Cohnella fermenti]|uniref:Exo-alpha-sialidase n=1 Tax=Cohnella fermenti TaxID=2565925 RepID=A0A4S4BM33_9BACL|nr:sialidase family protein [Cohnella fermenti]THF73446.1 exo-alpha-sialidase [Cohnella fermenti]
MIRKVHWSNLGLPLLAASLLFASGCQGSGGNANTTLPSESQTASNSASGSVPSSSPSDTSSSPAASPSSPAEPSSSSAPSSSAGQLPTGAVTALRLANDRIGWAGGDGWIARTDDGGKSWKVQYSQSSPVVQIFALNDRQVWATLDTESSKGLQLIRSTDGGDSWSEAGVVPDNGFLHFRSEKEGFSGSSRTTDGGATWATPREPEGLIGDVYFHDAKNGWAVRKGSGKFEFLHSADDGKTWTVVFTRESEVVPTNAVIRSTGGNDVWIELIGDSGMTQTSYSLFHTSDGGKSWTPVLVKNGAGSGPAPGFTMDDKNKPADGLGTSPGDLYVVDPKTAIAGGQCQACDTPNTLVRTTDGGKSWTAVKDEFPGYGQQLLAATDADHIWLVANDSSEPSALFTSDDGGATWSRVHEFSR